MFKSYEYIKYLPETHEYLYKIIDDDFEDMSATRERFDRAGQVYALIKVYQKRNFSIDDIGLNFAFFNIYYLQKYGKYWTPEELTQWQDEYIEKYNPEIKNYKQIAAARDKHLQTLYLFS